MNTNTNVTVVNAFTFRSGKRGRPLKGVVGETFVVLEKNDTLVTVARPTKPEKTWNFSVQEFNDWFGNATV